MNILFVIGIGAVLLLIAGRTYPYWIGRVFKQDDRNPPPSVTKADGVDYVKSQTQVVFAHHFASIAGAGPIVGPIIALAFGWGPAWLWIILGAIFYGAVHDMTTMFVSLREGGKTIAEIARRTLGTGGFLLLIAILILVLTLINAIFLNLSAVALTTLTPIENLGVSAEETVLRTIERDGVTLAQIGGIATTSVIIITAFAPFLGLMLHKRLIRGIGAFAIAAVVCVISVYIGFHYPVPLADDAERGQDIWRAVLTVYVFVSCWIPVWLIIQPRDFTNVQILYGGIILLLVGAVVAGVTGTTIDLGSIATLEAGSEALGGPIWPFLFITIACGAISGFHSLVATGTTVKQLPRESDCRRIGYNAMLLESFLALLVLVTVASHLSHEQYMSIVWPAEGAGNAVLAFALGCGQVFANLGIPIDIGAVLGILIIEGFLITTLDTSIRLCRYLLEELWNCLFKGHAPAFFKWRLTNTFIAVAGMLFFAWGQLYEHIWPIFGSGNQLMGALALTVVSVWLLRRKRPWLFAAIPAAFMVATTLAALWTKGWIDYEAENYPLAAAGGVLFLLSIAFLIVGGGQVWWAARKAAKEHNV